MTRYIGKQPAFGNFVKLDAISVVNGQAAYTMQSGSSNFTNYDNVNQFIVSLNGVIQAPTDSFTVSGSTITFASALSTGDVINFILVLGDVLSVGTPSDNTVSTVKLQDNAVTTAKITDANITTAKIADDAVDKDKVNLISTSSSAGLEVKGDGSSDGYLQLNCSQNSHGIKLKSPPHSSSQSYTLTFPSTAPATDKMLQTNSSGVLSFVDAPSGSHTLLSTTTISTNTASVEFTSGIDSTYKDYKITYSGMRGSDDNKHVKFTYSVDGGSNYLSSNYVFAGIGRDSGGTTFNTANGATSVIELTAERAGNASDESFNGSLILYNPSQSGFHKITGFESFYFTPSGNLLRMFGTGSNTSSTAPVNAVKIEYETGNIAEGVFKLYGIS